jgi:predicted nucleic acid-binding protein
LAAVRAVDVKRSPKTRAGGSRPSFERRLVSDAVLVDSGPLVALFDQDDPHHQSCRRALQTIRGSLLTVWPAVTEAMYLLTFSLTAQKAVLEMLELGSLRVASIDVDDLARIRELMTKYRDRPMDFADAALVRVAEREKLNRIFTIDRKDFAVYRILKAGRFSVLP